MRRKREEILAFAGCDDHLPKTVRDYRAKYKVISAALDAYPKLLEEIHRDLATLSEGTGKGREADFTSETILRALVVMMVDGVSYRDAVVRIAESDFLQDFLRTRKKAVMDHTFLNKCFKVIQPTTWKRVNELLGAHSVASESIDPSVLRVDTTVVETNIHWPTDSSLLWDTWRVASRLLQRARDLDDACCPHRFHDRKVKRLYLFVTRYMASPSKARQRKVKSTMRTLIQRVDWIVGIVDLFVKSCKEHASLLLQGIALQLEGFLPSMRLTVTQATRTSIRGEKVPARDRVFSIFDTAHGVDQARASAQTGRVRTFRTALPDCREVHHRLRGLRAKTVRLQPDRGGHQATPRVVQVCSGRTCRGQGLLPGSKRIRRTRGPSRHSGDPATHARPGQLGDERLAGFPGRNRGDDLRLKTRVSPRQVLFSFI